MRSKQLERIWNIEKMTNADNSMLPEEQAKYIQQTIWTILTNPNPSILDVALLPILVTDPRNGFSEETRKELMDEFIRFTRTQNNQDLLSEQMKQTNMSHASILSQINMSHASILSQINNSMQATTRQMDDNFRQCWIYNKNGFVNSYSQPSSKPERKKGKWQRRKDEDCWECSECHAVLENSDIENHNFYYCYHCGADMMDICGYMDLEKANYE